MWYITKVNIHMHLPHSLPENSVPASPSAPTVPVSPSDDSTVPFTPDSLAASALLPLNTQRLLLRLLFWHLLTYSNVCCINSYLTFDAHMYCLSSSPPECCQGIKFVLNFLIHQTQFGIMMWEFQKGIQFIFVGWFNFGAWLTNVSDVTRSQGTIFFSTFGPWK